MRSGKNPKKNNYNLQCEDPNANQKTSRQDGNKQSAAYFSGKNFELIWLNSRQGGGLLNWSNYVMREPTWCYEVIIIECFVTMKRSIRSAIQQQLCRYFPPLEAANLFGTGWEWFQIWHRNWIEDQSMMNAKHESFGENTKLNWAELLLPHALMPRSDKNFLYPATLFNSSPF